jgi:hypothetical protein
MTEQKASKYYAAEEEQQMKKVRASREKDMRSAKIAKSNYYAIVKSFKLTAQHRPARPHTPPNTASPLHPAPS